MAVVEAEAPLEEEAEGREAAASSPAEPSEGRIFLSRGSWKTRSLRSFSIRSEIVTPVLRVLL